MVQHQVSTDFHFVIKTSGASVPGSNPVCHPMENQEDGLGHGGIGIGIIYLSTEFYK